MAEFRDIVIRVRPQFFLRQRPLGVYKLQRLRGFIINRVRKTGITMTDYTHMRVIYSRLYFRF